jgi:hypothetical protein
MNDYPWKELLVDKDVNYLMEEDGKLIIIEKVPARVNPETGEQLLSSRTVQRLKEMIKEGKIPSRVIETPVYEFPA